VPKLEKIVGVKATNASHDVALVQAMLRVVKNAKAQPYLNAQYSGLYDGPTGNAITKFQTDQGLAKPPPAPGVKVPPAKIAVKLDTYGQVAPGSATFKKLVAMLPAAYAGMTIIRATKTVYLAGTAADRDASRKAIAKDPELEQVFRDSVASLVDTVFERHQIVLWLTPTGSRRTFAAQAAEVNTKAGPGESNHNFGRAVDIGFRGLTWLRGDTSLKKDIDWLNALEKTAPAKANAFWDARDAIALKEINLHRLGFERVHLQAFDNDKVSSGRSLVSLLNAVGAMKWSAVYVKPAWQYKSDLALGGALYNVGTSKQIWAGNAQVTKALIVNARNAKGAKVSEADIKEQEIVALKRALKKDFETADQKWITWKPVP
jgi:hypothetical protein